MDEFILEDEKEEKRHYLLIGFVIFVFIGCSLAFYMVKGKLKTTETPKEELEVEAPLEEVEEKEEEIAYVTADIKGAVKKPGVYQMPEGSRVIDAIEKAGGLRKDANTSLINLSKKIIDEMTIIIYTEEDISEWQITKKIQEYDNSLDKETTCPDNLNQACITESKDKKTENNQNKGKVSLNKATKEELTTLSGIGDSKADSIIEYRKKTPFKVIEDIKNIQGIGDSIFEKIKDHITI